jgi:transposase
LAGHRGHEQGGTGVSTNMENRAEIRRRVLVDGLGRRAACRAHGIHWKALRKALTHAEPPGYRRAAAKRPSILGPLPPAVHRILEDDRKAPGKQRRTAVRIFRRLRDEHGYKGGLTVVRDAVRAWKGRNAEAFAPLARPPGGARAGLGEAVVTLDGRPTKVAAFVMTRPCSDAIFCRASPRGCTEAFLEGHARAFAFFGGAPRRISYDDLKIAVAKATGSRQRRLADASLRLQGHHLFEAHLCPARRPDERGHVETLVGSARRNFPVPAPCARRPGGAQRPA